MSADNWRVCPKCLRDDEKDKERELKELKKAYGKVSEQEYLDMSARAVHRTPITVEHLREDFGIGMSTEGVFEISYKCSCDVCGFYFEYKYEKKALK